MIAELWWYNGWSGPYFFSSRARKQNNNVTNFVTKIWNLAPWISRPVLKTKFREYIQNNNQGDTDRKVASILISCFTSGKHIRYIILNLNYIFRFRPVQTFRDPEEDSCFTACAFSKHLEVIMLCSSSVWLVHIKQGTKAAINLIREGILPSYMIPLSIISHIMIFEVNFGPYYLLVLQKYDCEKIVILFYIFGY